MTSTHFDRFLLESLTTARETDAGLCKDELYGLYTSWCFLHQAAPQPEVAFWAAMKKKQIHPKGSGLRMKGPAAADYILASYPGLV